ncbi:filament-like plant protein 7 [Bidens hawaiensis]|uniref:filament-like plant protein 7 n=1 Tax=Bidens hawaiensis TaxID=980011 RepID=UPI00404A67C1
MMDHKSWLWKKKSIEKSMIAADKAGRGNEDELQGILAYEAELERNLNILNEKLSKALAEINAKDDMAKKQTNIAREAILGWETAEAEVLTLKQELEKTTQQMVAGEERLYGVDAALKECMQQLRFVHEEQEKRVHDAVMKTSREYEKTRVIIEEKLSESNKRLSKLTSENAQLTKALLAKEKTIDELHAARCQLDSDLSSVMSQLESTQRDNASLSYEVRVLEKQLEISNEERDFNRKTADVAHKQHLESVKRIAKLETEAQRLRVLVRKRLPGPAALTKMKNEVEMLGRKSNPFDQTSEKQISFLTEQLCALEDENRVLKEFINRKTNEQPKSQTSRNLTSHDFHILGSSSDMGSDEKASMAESWAPSCKTVEASDIGLMDDFVEMEKLAIVSVEKPLTFNLVSDNHSDWVENISKMILEHSRITQRDSNDTLKDITVALAQENDEKLSKSMNGSIERLIELIEGLKLYEKDDSSETSTGYTARVLQWKTSELGAVLEAFLESCSNLLNGKAGLETFAKELTLTLEWIVNHCFSLQDVSSMRHEMEKHFDWDEADKETKNLKDDVERLELVKMELEHKLELEISMSEIMVVKLQESEKVIEDLKMDVELLKQQKDVIEDQMKVKMKVKEDLDEQLIEAIGNYNDVCRISTSSEEMEAGNLDELALVVPESTIKQDIQKGELENDEKKLQSEREILAASEKLAECQETILNLGKQLKALTSPRNSSVPEKLIISNPTYQSPPPTPPPIPAKTNHQRVSLLDKMMADDEAHGFQSPKPKEITRTVTSPAVMENNNKNAKNVKVISPKKFLSVNGIKHQEDEEALVNFLSIVPSKKKKSGMLRKLLWRKKK